MRKNLLFIVLLSALLIFSAVYLWPRISLLAQPAFTKNGLNENKEEALPFLANETINYAVKLKGIGIGRATLTYKGKTKLDGKDVHLVFFHTNTMNFKDKETMYADIDNFLPLRIERDINNWGEKMRIVEEYDQKNHSLTITRFSKGHQESRTIQKDANIQNLILLTFLYRKLGGFKIGKEFSITLPLIELAMRITKEEKIKVPCGLYRAYLAESFPKGHQIWFEDSSKSLPVKISGPLFLGSVSLDMIEYIDGSNLNKR